MLVLLPVCLPAQLLIHYCETRTTAQLDKGDTVFLLLTTLGVIPEFLYV